MQITQRAITGEETIDDDSQPYAALVNFYAAFNNRDVALMSSNWLHTDEVSMSNPLGGLKRGWPDIEAVYKRIFTGAAKVYVEFYDYSIHTDGIMFVAAGRERGILRHAGEEIELAIRTTRVYIRRASAWKHLHHHGSMDNPEVLSRYQSVVLSK